MRLLEDHFNNESGISVRNVRFSRDPRSIDRRGPEHLGTEKGVIRKKIFMNTAQSCRKKNCISKGEKKIK